MPRSSVGWHHGAVLVFCFVGDTLTLYILFFLLVLLATLPCLLEGEMQKAFQSSGSEAFQLDGNVSESN
jgi:hypothetical protein